MCHNPESQLVTADESAIEAERETRLGGSFSAMSISTVNLAQPSELGDDLNVSHANMDRTAELAANAPRYRRKSSTFIDGIHDVAEDQGDLAPAQLYSTMSGRLFHSGRIAIVMVGLPARGKT